MNEYIPVRSFQFTVRFWWLIVLLGLLGGGGGFIFHRLHPPEYRATASFYVTIDISSLNSLGLPVDQIQYNEDLGLAATVAVLRSSDVTAAVIAQLEKEGIVMDINELTRRSTVERKHAFWELHFDYPDPNIAMMIVNTWAGIGFEAMKVRQAAGEIVSYVQFVEMVPSTYPEEPILYNRNYLVLAGIICGFLISVLIIEILAMLLG